MKILKPAIILCLAIALSSCNENRIYETHNDNFPQFYWEKGRKVEFSPEINDNNPEYKLLIAIRHVYGFNLRNVNIRVEIIAPSGISDTREYEIITMDEKGQYTGECSVDICDLETVVEERYKFKETGIYKIEVEQITSFETLPNVMEVGVIVEKTAQ